MLHIVLFLGYPETGPYGLYYLAGSILLWSGFVMFMNLNLKLVRFFSGALSLVLNAAVFAAMAAAVVFTMPQHDRVPVYEKIQEGRYPTRDDLETGMIKLGLKKPTIRYQARQLKRELERETRKALDKLKED
ncbi:MAG: hypothetical protein RDU13_11470 [Elusimicrobiales bacterium]|nr:hypothetical protein [Elusimicrobiales bacterium]